MSAAVSQAAGEAAAGAPAFSYAQAAKGRSPSLSAAPQSSKSNLDNGEPTQRSASAHQAVGASGSESLQGARRASEGQLVKEKVEEAPLKNDAMLPHDAKPTPENQNTSSPATSDNQTQLARSPPPSPGFGSTSTSTLPKEDDASATPNASSESTWDKVSQTSQNAEKVNERADGDDEDSKLSSWEHVSASAMLKEAPPPAFNIWTKRAMDQKAKTTKEPKLSQSLSGNSNKDPLQQGAKKPVENVPDLGKLDGKKRTKSGQVSDDKSTSPTARDAGKPGDGRYRNPEDGMFPDITFDYYLLTGRKQRDEATVVVVQAKLQSRPRHPLLHPHLQEMQFHGPLRILLKRIRRSCKIEVTKPTKRKPQLSRMERRNGYLYRTCQLLFSTHLYLLDEEAEGELPEGAEKVEVEEATQYMVALGERTLERSHPHQV